MAEQKKRDPRFWSEEEWREAITSWIAESSDTDFDELETPMTKEIWDALLGTLKTPEEN